MWVIIKRWWYTPFTWKLFPRGRYAKYKKCPFDRNTIMMSIGSVAMCSHKHTLYHAFCRLSGISPVSIWALPLINLIPERWYKRTPNSLTNHVFPSIIDLVKEKIRTTRTRWNNVIIAKAQGNCPQKTISISLKNSLKVRITWEYAFRWCIFFSKWLHGVSMDTAMRDVNQTLSNTTSSKKIPQHQSL